MSNFDKQMWLMSVGVYVWIMVMHLFRRVVAGMASYAKHLCNAFTSAHALCLFTLRVYVCIHTIKEWEDKAMPGIHPAFYTQLFFQSFQVSILQERTHELE